MNDNARHLVESLIAARIHIRERLAANKILTDVMEDAVWEACVEIAAVVYSNEVNTSYEIHVPAKDLP